MSSVLDSIEDLIAELQSEDNPAERASYIDAAIRYRPVFAIDISALSREAGYSKKTRRLHAARDAALSILCRLAEKENKAEAADNQETEYWYPRQAAKRDEQPWPPVPTTESLSYWLTQAAKTHEKYLDEKKYRHLIDTASYCLEMVPTDVAENVLYYLPVSSRKDPATWSGTFNELAAVLRRPPVSRREAETALKGILPIAA